LEGGFTTVFALGFAVFLAAGLADLVAFFAAGLADFFALAALFFAGFFRVVIPL